MEDKIRKFWATSNENTAVDRAMTAVKAEKTKAVPGKDPPLAN